MKKIILLSSLLLAQWAQADVNIYTDRPREKVKVMADAFEKQTGERVNIVDAKNFSVIYERLNTPGVVHPFDVIFVKDLIYLNTITEKEWFQKLDSQVAIEKVHPSMQTENWTAITYRARTLVYDKRFDVSGINTYEDLADPKYAGTLCLRTSEDSYNKALGASLLAAYGKDQAQELLFGWLLNLKTFGSFYSGDSTIIKDIAKQDGTCTLGITNSYYLGLQLADNPDLPVGIKFLSLPDGGVSTNGIGAGIYKDAPNPEGARAFIEFMLTPDMQMFFSTANQDFPANTSVEFPEVIKDWMGFPVSNQNWGDYKALEEDVDQVFFKIDYK